MRDEQTVTDEELVALAQQSPSGDLRAFESLVERYQERIVANCRHLSGSREDGEDLAQEVFVKVFLSLSGFEGRAKFRTWLNRIKVNHCMNFIRKTKSTALADLTEPGVQRSVQLYAEPIAEHNVEVQADRQRIGKVLRAMSETFRMPLVMRDMDSLSYEEIAAGLDIGLSAAKMRVKRGREEFRRLYEAELEDDASAGIDALSA